MANDILNNIKNDAYFKDVIKKNNISDEEINDNLNVFEEAYNSLKLCDKCPGIDKCPQKVKGEIYTVEYNGRPVSVIRYCKAIKHQKELDELYNSYLYTDIPKSLLNVNLDNIEPLNNSQGAIYKILSDISIKQRDKGLYICGGFGVGKTYFASALANSLVANGSKVVFVKSNSFVTDMYTLLMNDSNAFERLLNTIKNADYLIIDDIGTENVTAFSRDRLLYNILDYRMENKMCTIFTSNYDIKNLKAHFDQLPDANAERLCERIVSLVDVRELEGENQRHD